MVMRRQPAPRALRGVTMIEVLVTMVIIAFGLLGIAGLQVRLQSSEMEAYQRTQALLLLEDLKQRIEANRLEAANYPTNAPLTAPVGAAMAQCPVPAATATRAERDISEWCNALQGAAETSGANRVGSMIGGRGCVEDLGIGGAGDLSLRITVAWQGMTALSAPAESCGSGSYNGPGCDSDRCRRTVSTIVRIANLK
jgi:type IV pilus assembly protein PilV